MMPAGVRIFLCVEPVDMRRGFDRLAVAARELLGKDVQCGGVFIFHGKSRRCLKLVWMGGHGCCVLYKRLHGARFVLPRREGAVPTSLDAHELATLLQGVKLTRLREKMH